uniref:Calcineurin-like phosphoesterase domain-containing protein n=1 Tax=Parascaris equorum TaxID=6256 RepID=A0A914RTF4_PAREQ
MADRIIVPVDPLSEKPIELWRKYLRQGRIHHFLRVSLKRKFPKRGKKIFSGDFTNYGDVGEVIKFNAEIGKLPHKYKIVVAGNHEIGFEDGEEMNERQLAAFWIYGAPWHTMPGYSFYRSRGQSIMSKWNLIPSKIDVLVTHSPPLGHGDFNSWNKCDGLLAGCADLLNTVEMRVKPNRWLTIRMKPADLTAINE